MRLTEMMTGLAIKESKGTHVEAEITGIAYDSRKVTAGDLFVALRGEKVDGHRYIAGAVSSGAAAILHEGEAAMDLAVPSICVSDSRAALAHVAAVFHGHPSRKMRVIGVTGTNGKTTTTRIIKSIIEAGGESAGLIGTIGYMVGKRSFPAPHTTPEAPEFQGLLSQMADAGCGYAISEVSSHALSMQRVEGTSFSCSVFTNLTRDHLDYHHDMETYFRAKSRLFSGMLGGAAIVNIDDIWGERLMAEMKKQIVLSVGITNPKAAVRASDIRCKADGTAFTLTYLGRDHKIESPLVGLVNVYNILCASAVGIAMGFDWQRIGEGVRLVPQIEGRFEKVEMGQDFLCIVDYAHTGDALQRLIEGARAITRGRIITVFGCGGDRDRGKRPIMGKHATELSDQVFITSDNPRAENPMDIIREIVSGVERENFRIVPDRAQAIFEAIAEAHEGDTVLIAGKGHEDYQEIGGVRHPFNDKTIAEDAILRRTRK